MSGLTMRKSLRSYLGMTKRNMQVYLKDKMTVFFSMLGPIIVLGLYVLFLKQNYVEMINSSLEGLAVSSKDIDAFINSWLIAGILGTSCITVSLNSLGVMVSDKEKKIDYDYTASPMKGRVVVLSYFTACFICTFIVTGIVLLCSLIYLAISGTFYLSVLGVIELVFTLLLGSISATIVMMLIVSFFSSSNAMGAFMGIITAAVGFIIGAYIPIAEFSTGIQNMASLIPGSHIAALFRNELMSPVLDRINTSLAGVDGGAFVNAMKEEFSFNILLFGRSVGPSVMYIYAVVFSVVVIGINIFLYRFSSKRK